MTSLESIQRKVESGERLSPEEGLLLFDAKTDLHAVGQMADAVRRRKCGEVVHYNRNSHLNPTNVCALRCGLCAFSRDPADADAYVMRDEEILARGQEAADAGCTELHVVGGLHPGKGYAWYRGILELLHEAFPSLHLKAWTAVEIDWFAHSEDKPVAAILEELMDAGLGSLPGGGAEIFASEVRARICPRKIDAERWLAVHREAHRVGLKSNATMLYGHVESPADRIDHMVRLRRLQDATGGFQAFIPLAFHPENTRFADLPRPTGLDDLRVMAAARLMLDNFPHVKAYWISLGIGTAQTALAYGADDLDGTVRQERIYHDAGATSPEVLGVDDLRALIREAGREPVERDSVYRRVMKEE